MKTLLNLFILLLFAAMTNAQSAADIVKRSDDKMKGEESSFSRMTMKIIRPTWERTVSFKSWTKGNNLSLALVTAPAREEGQAYLRRDREMWSWNPTINRLIKMPPSMLSQGWMGSDFTNDDLLNESSIVVDYNHTLLGNETISGFSCHKIESVPKENAPVVWGKILLWISTNEYLQLQAEYYDEDGYLVKTETASEVKNMDGRTIPTRFELNPADEPGHKTVLIIDEITFNKPIDNSFFTQQNMKKLR